MVSDNKYEWTKSLNKEAHTYITKTDARIAELEKFKKLVEFIANDYHELSHDKAQWQRDDWKKRCKKLIEEYYEMTEEVK